MGSDEPQLKCVHESKEGDGVQKMHLEPEQQSVWGAFTRLIDISQNLLADHVKLAQIQAREEISSISGSLILILATIPFILIGWISFWAGLAIKIEPKLPIETSMLILGFFHLFIGGLGAYIGLNRLKSKFSTENGEHEKKTDERNANRQ